MNNVLHLQNKIIQDFKNILNLNNIYADKHISKNHALNTILNKIFQTRPIDTPRYLWDESFYGLDKSSLFNQLGEATRLSILEDLTNHQLNVAYHVELSGLSFCSKMIILSQTIEEKMLYSQQCADEAQHLYSIIPYLKFGSNSNYKMHGLLKIISDIIQNSDKNTMRYIIQVVLEGWGVSHFSKLKDHCQHENFKNVLKKILVDEAYHHGSGVVLVKQDPILEQQVEIIADAVDQIVSTVALGPILRLKRIIEDRLNRVLSEEDFLLLLEETNTIYEIDERVSTIKKIIEHTASEKLIDKLTSLGTFSKVSIEKLLV